MTRSPPVSKHPHPRAGLAPLELTLTLPLLVMLMALMINFGVVGAWKVRTQGNAHYAAFRSLLGRTGDWNPPPDNWPNATLGAGGGNSLPTVGQIWDSHADTSHPRADWIRGDWLTAPHQVVPVHVEGRLEFDDGVHTGTAGMSRNVPLLRGATSNGRFGFSLTQEVLDNRWQFHTLGLGDNHSSRARVWWDIEHNDLVALDAQIAEFKAQLDAAQQQLMANPHPEYLFPLDQDVEFQIYSGHHPNFYPGLRIFCARTSDEFAESQQYSDLLSEIQNLPCSMSNRFIALYTEWICRLECCGGQADDTPLRERFNDLAQLVRQLKCGNPQLFMDCQPCDPGGSGCRCQRYQCPAPTPDTDGL